MAPRHRSSKSRAATRRDGARVQGPGAEVAVDEHVATAESAARAPSRAETGREPAAPGRGVGPGRPPGVRGRPAVFTREDILAAAKAAFSEAGYANVTLDDLAAQLNTGKGTLYYHSNRKVDLLIAISNATVENNTKEIRKYAAVDASPETRFVLAMRALLQGVLSDRQASKVYFENEADLPPKFRANLRRLLREIQEIFVGIIADGVEAGVFKGDPRISAKHVLAICGWPYRWFSHDGKMSLDEFITSAVNFALGGLRADNTVRPVRSEPRVAKSGKAASRTPPTA